MSADAKREIVKASGLLLIADPHLADVPPGQRTAGYLDQIMAKLAACLDHAMENDLAPIILGDLFHWPRENSNRMLVDLIRLFAEKGGPHGVRVLVGNHDKYQARFTEDVSLAVLREAGAVTLMDEFGVQFVLETPDGSALICASPDGTPLPKKFEPETGDPETVVWLTHHNIQFPEFLERAHGIKELPGIHWLINGHIHRPQPTVRKGMTTWANPGNITRLTFTRRSMVRKPAAAIWRPGMDELEIWEIPHLPFTEIFPDQELPPEEQETEGQSRFLQGLERLAWQRTREGTGLKQFLDENLPRDTDDGRLIWELYEEVAKRDQ